MENTTEDKELLLNQWQTCVDMANSVSQRRDNMNNIFITLNLVRGGCGHFLGLSK